MNPLYLAMMQQQGQQPSPMPGMPTSAPTDPLQMMPQQPASPSYTNPFDSGISKAIEGARASVALSQAQKQEAFSKSLAAFAAALSQPQQQYWGDDPRSAMMRQLGASLAPGMQTYNQAEDQFRQENLGMADYMVKLKSTQDEALRKVLKEQRDRQHQEDVLEETKRHHQETEKYKKQKLGTGESAFAKTITLNGKEYPAIESKQEHKMFITDQKNAGSILAELDSIERDYKGFRGLVKDNWIDPQAPYYVGSLANTVNDVLGSTGASPEKNTQLIKRKALEAKLGRFNLIQEKLHKGGVLTESMIKRFEQKGLLPSLDDRPEVFEQKMKDLKQMVSHAKQAADMTLKTGYVFTPFDLEHGEAKPEQTGSQNTQTPSSPQGEVLMRKPDGEEVFVHPDDVTKAEQQGFAKL